MAEEIKLVLSADDEKLQAAFGRARAAVGAYEKKVETSRQAALRAALGQEEVLKLQAAGHDRQAQALQREIKLHDEARRLAEQTGITEQKAIAMLERKAALQRQIAANQASMGAGGRAALPEMPLTPAYLASLERAKMLKNQMAMESNRMAGGVRNGGMAMLELSRAAEDAQYGMNGVINNIPGLVMSLGGKAGVAGAVSLIAVAAYQAWKQLNKMLGEKEWNAWEDARQKAVADYYSTMEERKRFLRDEEAAIKLKRDMEELQRRENSALQESIGLNQERFDALKNQADILRETRSLEDQLNAARQRFTPQKSGAVADWQRAADEYNRNQARTSADLAAKQKELVLIGRELNGVWEKIGWSLTKYQVLVANSAKETMTLRERVFAQETELARSEAQLEQGRNKFTKELYDAEAKNRDVVKERLELSRGQLAQAEAQLAVYQDLLTNTREIGDETKRQLQTRLDGAKEEIRHLEQRQKLTRKIGKLEEESIRRKGLMDEHNRTANRNQEAILKEIEKAEERMRQNKARGSFAADMVALRLEASGRKAEADALRGELAMRAEAVERAKELGISEERALGLLRERQRLLDKIKQGESGSGGRQGGIRRAAADRLQAGGGRIESGGRGAFLGDDLGRSPGLRNAAIEARSEKRAAGARPTEKLSGLLARQNELGERMVKIFEGLGAY
jgi:hypothetical protein